MINPVVRDRYRLSKVAMAALQRGGISSFEAIEYGILISRKNEITYEYLLYRIYVCLKRFDNESALDSIKGE